ncbi:tRNA N(3)-methylcytidine methyltransferase METTL6 isoform X3 [Phoenix dactylifera]|uniref:tRNA N(3)-methylcytidine methyltransferase METTL6 isoform X3 n=1 Tax=Phoenix dactylifera TaxID=42345 RepID=A0A8B8JC40_PHODC|nr:tRNA N(3)-methylcytidine methyltransferase METTL6 isoform X3 [Phoenix dactylifera]
MRETLSSIGTPSTNTTRISSLRSALFGEGLGTPLLAIRREGPGFCSSQVVLEVGCGAGNTVFPLLVAFPDVFVHACDFSPLAIELVKEHGAFKLDRVNAFVCDVITDDLCKMIMPGSVDVITMIFMLSAVSPMKMSLALQNVRNVLKPSGTLLFRDYAMGDYAQISCFFSISIYWFCAYRIFVFPQGARIFMSLLLCYRNC